MPKFHRRHLALWLFFTPGKMSHYGLRCVFTACSFSCFGFSRRTKCHVLSSLAARYQRATGPEPGQLFAGARAPRSRAGMKLNSSFDRRRPQPVSRGLLYGARAGNPDRLQSVGRSGKGEGFSVKEYTARKCVSRKMAVAYYCRCSHLFWGRSWQEQTYALPLPSSKSEGSSPEPQERQHLFQFMVRAVAI